MRALRLIIAAGIAAGLIAGAVWIAAPPRFVGWDRLEAGVDLRLPDGEGPFPVAVLLHGCGGIRPFIDGYADAALEAGAAVVVLDSLAPRGIGRLRAMTALCTGWRLRGGARARDVRLVLENLDDPRLDMNRVSLAGWSHGAWTAAELLTEGPADRGIRSAFLVYPYCRFPARWPGRRAPERVEIVAVVPELDAVGDARACRAALERSGADVVRVADATHAFEEDYRIPFPFRHNAAAFAENRERFGAFLRRTLSAETGDGPRGTETGNP